MTHSPELKAAIAAAKEAEREAKEAEREARRIENEERREREEEERKARKQREAEEKGLQHAQGQESAFAAVNNVIEKLDSGLDMRDRAKAFCRAMTDDMVAVIASIALNPFEQGTTRIAAAEKVLQRGLGDAPDYLKPMSEDLSTMSFRDAMDTIMRKENRGDLSMTEADHLRQAMKDREASELDTLRDEIGALRALLTGDDGKTINGISYQNNDTEH